MDTWCIANCAAGNCPESHCYCPEGELEEELPQNDYVPEDEDEDETTESVTCYSVAPYSSQAGMDDWCVTNCALGYCPQTHCICVTTEQVLDDDVDDLEDDDIPPPGCVPVGLYMFQPGMYDWCSANCALGYCPPSHCKCL